jgi:hypothetical protein
MADNTFGEANWKLASEEFSRQLEPKVKLLCLQEPQH